MFQHDRVHSRKVTTLSERMLSVAVGALVGAVLSALVIDLAEHTANASPMRPIMTQTSDARVNIPSISLKDAGLEVVPPEFDDLATISQADLYCLAHAVYYEARGEKFVGMLAVANVIMNRVTDPDYPKTVCDVTRQRSRSTCQFEYYCKVGNRVPSHTDPQWQMANDIAFQVMAGSLPDLTDGATRFHAISGNRPLPGSLRIGSHLFYRR